MKKLLKKLKSKGAFTLVEMLAAIIVLLLVTQIISLMVSMSVKYYTKSVRESEAQVVCGTLASAVQEELQYATKVQGASGGSYTYYSRARAHGSGCTLEAVDGHLVVSKNGTAYPLVGSQTYTYDTVASIESYWDETDKQFTVTISVLESESATEPLATETFKVSPVNEGI